MPGKKKGRKFIDRKIDVVHHFKVVQRSQQDPLVADETAPQSVLVDNRTSHEKDPKEVAKKYGVYFDDDYNYLQHLRGTREAVEWESAEVEVYTLRKRDPRENSKKSLKKGALQLPSSAFESYVEEPIGLLNKAAPLYGPQPDLDPDVVAGLDHSDFDDGEETDLPDDFVMMLNSEEPMHGLENKEDGGNVAEWLSCGVATNDNNDLLVEEQHAMGAVNWEESGEAGWEDCAEDEYDEEDNISQEGFFNDSDDDEERDEVGSLNGIQKTYKSEGAKSQFTNYSLSSSVLPRSELLSLLDDRFEEKFLKEYDDEHVGPLDMEDIDGFVGEDSELFKQAIKGTRKEQEDFVVTKDEHDRVKKWIKHMQKHHIPENFEQITIVEKETNDEKWDCASILSTYSNIYNHPKCINTNEIGPPSKRTISINPQTGMPFTRRKSRYLNKRNLKGLNSDDDDDSSDDEMSVLRSMISTISMRPKDETPEERILRKMATKEYRKARREEKKINKLQFKEEKKKQNVLYMRELNNKKLIKI